jgi:hypothetical protein
MSSALIMGASTPRPGSDYGGRQERLALAIQWEGSRGKTAPGYKVSRAQAMSHVTRSRR